MRSVTGDRSSESGAVVGFILVGVVIAALLTGGLYLINWRSDQIAQKGPSVSQANDDKDAKKDKDTPGTSQPPANETDDSNGTQTEQTPSPTPATPTPNPAAPQPGADGIIAETGPADTFLQVVGIGALVGAIVRYRQSRRSLSPR